MKVVNGPWIKAGTHDARWVSGASDGKTKPCYLQGEMVLGNQPRLLIDNGKGYKTELSHHKKNQYYCEDCALRVYGLKYEPIMDKQERFAID